MRSHQRITVLWSWCIWRSEISEFLSLFNTITVCTILEFLFLLLPFLGKTCPWRSMFETLGVTFLAWASWGPGPPTRWESDFSVHMPRSTVEAAGARMKLSQRPSVGGLWGDDMTQKFDIRWMWIPFVGSRNRFFCLWSSLWSLFTHSLKLTGRGKWALETGS